MVIAKRIRGLREQKCLSLDDLAARAGLPASVISRLEDGREIPTCEVLERLAEASFLDFLGPVRRTSPLVVGLFRIGRHRNVDLVAITTALFGLALARYLVYIELRL